MHNQASVPENDTQTPMGQTDHLIMARRSDLMIKKRS